MSHDSQQDNAAHFLILRIVLASAVLFSHFPRITATPPTLSLMSPTLAVQAFFVISGWVVSASFARSSTLGSFWLRRAARLYPLYACVIIVQAFAAWLIVQPSSDVTNELLSYLTVNFAFMNFLQPTLFGLLADAPVKAFNPSLWTLKLEVIFYVLTPLLVTIVRAQRAIGTAVLFVASIAMYYLSLWHSEALARQFPGQFRFFVAGIALWQLSEHIHAKPRLWHALTAIGAFYIANRTVDVASLGVLQPVTVALFVYGAAYALPEPKQLPDVSYGIYVWHGPLIQFALILGLMVNLWIACAATLVVAALCWYVVEKPAIQFARKLSVLVEKRRGLSLSRRAG
ncbi:MAG TPA: acyltransferase [Polyangiales bacterium]|nr:acyltransferase [Polyangiales bacterium]